MDKQIQSWTYLALSNGQKTNILTQNLLLAEFLGNPLAVLKMTTLKHVQIKTNKETITTEHTLN